MNEAFAVKFSSVLAALTSDLRFYYKPDDTLIPPQIVETMLPSKDRTYQEGQDIPLVRWAIYEGAFEARRPAPFSVMLTGGIYTPGTIIDGTRDITALAMALGKIVDNRSFPPYRLNTPVGFTIGSPEPGSEGLQPHPYYWLTMQLQFLVP